MLSWSSAKIIKRCCESPNLSQQHEQHEEEDPMSTQRYSTMSDKAIPRGLAQRKAVIFDPVTRDYRCQFDDQLIGYATTHAAGIAMLDAFADDLLVAGLLDPLPDTPPAPPVPPAPPFTASAEAPGGWQLTRLSLT